MSFAKNGYKVFKIFNSKEIIDLRKKFIEAFNLISINNNYKRIRKDEDIENLYIKRKKHLYIICMLMKFHIVIKAAINIHK